MPDGSHGTGRHGYAVQRGQSGQLQFAPTVPGEDLLEKGASKSERANIGQDELKVLPEVAHDLLAFDDRQLIDALSGGEIIEVHDGKD